MERSRRGEALPDGVREDEDGRCEEQLEYMEILNSMGKG